MFKGERNYHNAYRTLTEEVKKSSSSYNSATTVGASWDGMNWVQSKQDQSHGRRLDYYQGQPQQKQQPQQQQYYSHSSASPQQKQQQRQRQHARPRPLPSSELPKIPPQISTLDPHSAPTADLVTYFSTIYQYYAQQKEDPTIGNSERQWAEYYADLSTRAAHHYNDLLQGETKEKEVTEQERKEEDARKMALARKQMEKKKEKRRQEEQRKLQLQSQSHGHWEDESSSIYGPKSNQTSNSDAAGAGGAPPPSFQEYAHRNLSRCTTSTQKSAMTELVQMTIQRAVRDGSMFTKRWEVEPLLPMSMSSTGSPSANVNAYSNVNTATTTADATNHFDYNTTFSRSPKGKSQTRHPQQQQQQHQYSYLDAVKGKNSRSSSSGGSSAITGGTGGSGNKRKNSSNGMNSMSSSSPNVQSKKAKSESYDDLLPQNDSYYGAPAPRRTSTTSFTSTNSGNYNTMHNTIHNNPNIHNNNSNYNNNNSEGKYDDLLPTNDSYYGRGSSKNSSGGGGGGGGSASSHGSYSKSSEKNNNDFEFGDYISLSSLSTTKYIKKNNKLIKASSFSSSSSPNNNSGLKKKKKPNLLKSAKSSKSKLASRLNRFSGQGGIQDATSSTLHNEYSRSDDIDRYMGRTVIGGNSKKVLDEDDYEQMTVRGTCQVLEKEYLRLTAPPRAELVRPRAVLEEHLSNLKDQWKKYRNDRGKVNEMKKKNSKKRDYNWFCSQLKAIRQDLTVQRIFNAFAVEVYETHAKIALEEGDLNEYNQSQTKLKELYELLSHNRDNESLTKGLKNQNEFIAYRIIYYIFLTGNKKYDGGSSDLFKIMLSLSSEQRQDPCIAHALKVRVAVAENDYHSFFSLQDTCPNIGAYLMDMMIEQVRATGLQCMMKAYRPSLSVEFILNELGFNFNGELDVHDGLSWLVNCGCKLNEDKSLVVTKNTVLNESNLIGKKNSSLI